jgi:hypothetical protein
MGESYLKHPRHYVFDREISNWTNLESTVILESRRKVCNNFGNVVTKDFVTVF